MQPFTGTGTSWRRLRRRRADPLGDRRGLRVGLWFAVGWASKGISNGSIVKTRLGELLPSWPSITAAAVVWFSVVESLEHDGHADAPASVLIAAIVVFSFLARALGRAFLQVLSDAVFGDRGLAPKSRMPGWTMTAAVPLRPALRSARALRAPSSDSPEPSVSASVGRFPFRVRRKSMSRNPLGGLVAASLVFAATVLSACASPGSGAKFAGTAIEPAIQAPDFTLEDQYGHTWTLSQQHGRTVALMFGYTHCTDTCPLMMAKLGDAPVERRVP